MKNVTRTIGFGYLAIVLLTTLATALLGPLGYAPVPLSFGPAPDPVVVTVWASSDKQAWLTEAARRFEATNPRQGRQPVTIVVVSLGSDQMVERIVNQNWQGANQPTVVSPSSTLSVEALRNQWSAGNSTPISTDNGTSLVLSPLVLVSWQERARFLWPQAQGDLWQPLHAALADDAGWPLVVEKAGFGADSAEYERARSWGPVKFGHTSPLNSSSGVETLLLMAYAFHGKTSGLTVADVQSPAFVGWLQQVERAVPKFGDSDTSFMDELVRFGPSQYDVIATYENLAITNIQNTARWGTLQVYYPPGTTVSDHPYAILNAAWVSASQRAAAEQFQAFLASRPIQELALQYGFRPVDPGVAITTPGPNNPFTRFQSNGLRSDLGGQVAIPAPEVVDALVTVWQQVR